MFKQTNPDVQNIDDWKPRWERPCTRDVQQLIKAKNQSHFVLHKIGGALQIVYLP